MKRSKAVLWGVLTAAFFLLALSAALLERAGVSLTDQLGGALTGIGTGGWAFCLTHFLTELYFRFRPKARRAQEIGEKDERNPGYPGRGRLPRPAQQLRGFSGRVAGAAGPGRPRMDLPAGGPRPTWPTLDAISTMC